MSPGRLPGTGPQPEGGPARSGTPGEQRLAPGAKPGGTSARSHRGTKLPHRTTQVPFASTPEDPRSYYGQPVIKAPVWKWYIAAYFFTGGLAGASAPLAAIAGARGNAPLERRAWSVALLAITVSPVLLIADLGKPERFHHMLRLAKVTSPMSVGTWVISAMGAATGLAWIHSLLGAFPRAGTVAGGAAAVLGPVVSTYTAVLVSDTAVPAWHDARDELPFVFAASSAAAAGGAALVLTPCADAGPARRVAIGGAVAELAATVRMEHRLGGLAEPYHRGRTGRLAKAAKACTAIGAALAAARGRRRAPAAISGGLLLAGSALERWAVFHAGSDSAADPKYTVAPQRARKEARLRAAGTELS